MTEQIDSADPVCGAESVAANLADRLDEFLQRLYSPEEREQPLHRRRGESYGDWSRRVAEAFNDIWEGLGEQNRTELFPALWRVVTDAHGWED